MRLFAFFGTAVAAAAEDRWVRWVRYGFDVVFGRLRDLFGSVRRYTGRRYQQVGASNSPRNQDFVFFCI